MRVTVTECVARYKPAIVKVAALKVVLATAISRPRRRTVLCMV
jgi:hypothetical protein